MFTLHYFVTSYSTSKLACKEVLNATRGSFIEIKLQCRIVIRTELSSSPNWFMKRGSNWYTLQTGQYDMLDTSILLSDALQEEKYQLVFNLNRSTAGVYQLIIRYKNQRAKKIGYEWPDLNILFKNYLDTLKSKEKSSEVFLTLEHMLVILFMVVIPFISLCIITVIYVKKRKKSLVISEKIEKFMNEFHGNGPNQ